MRTLFLFFVFCFCCSLTAQDYDFKTKLPGAGVSFFSGSMEGINNMLLFHYWDFKRIAPNSNDQFWNPEISWENKYEKTPGGELVRPLAPRFPGSRTFLSWTTDGFHATKRVKTVTMYFGIVLIIGAKKKPFKHYMYDALIFTGSKNAGFHFTYSLLPKLF